jgi:hypothetical protein
MKGAGAGLDEWRFGRELDAAESALTPKKPNL